MTYSLLKTVHILSMVLLFGVGLGSAFYKWMADKSGNVTHIAVTNRHVVLADWVFTTPTVILQPLSGIWLVYLLGIPLTVPWVMISLFLYTLAGLCWLPVVWLQIRMLKIAEISVATRIPLPKLYWQMARCWFWLGVPAFFAMILIVVLMIFKRIPEFL